MTSSTASVDCLIQWVARAEITRARDGLKPSMIAIDLGISSLTVEAAEARASEIRTAQDISNYTGVPVEAFVNATTDLVRPPWSSQIEGWGRLLEDIGDYLALLDDWAVRLVRLEFRPPSLAALLKSERHELLLRVPLDGTTFSGGLPSDLGAEFRTVFPVEGSASFA